MGSAYLYASCRAILFNVACPIVVVRILAAAVRVGTLRYDAIDLCRIFVFTARTRPAREAVAMVGRLQPRSVFCVAKPSGAVFLVRPVAQGLPGPNVVGDFRREISVVGGMNTANCRFFSRFRVATRQGVCRETGLFKEFVWRAHPFLGY